MTLVGLVIIAIALGARGTAGASSGHARAEAEVRYPGEHADDNFGFALASAGDVDGDGTIETIIGAIFNDDGGSAAGKAYVFPGGRSFSTTPLATMTGEAPDDHFGISVASAGDVNADGLADVIVGARLSDRAASAAGAAFLFYGARPMDGQADLVLTGEFKDDWFGQSVSGAGDANGDGFADLIVGAPFNDDRGSAAGKAYLFFGGLPPGATPPLALHGDAQDDGQFGWSVAGAGDVNGDGFDDLVIGARLYGTGPDRARGRAYVFFGGRPPDAVPDLVLTGEFQDDWFGHAVAGGGDVNDDGFADVLVGAPFFDDRSITDFRSAVGRIYIFFGGPVPDLVPDLLLTGDQGDEQLGWALDGGEDIDGDGFDDLVGGARFYDDGLLSAVGRVVVAYGSSGPALRGGPRLPGLAADDQFGHDLALLGSPAGVGSLAGGAPFSDVAGSGAGEAARLSLRCILLDLDRDTVAVNGCRDFEGFSVYRGRVADLAGGDPGACLGRLAPPLTAIDDPESPAPGDSFFYLATGLAAGLEGHPGFRSDGSARPLPPSCP